MRPDPAPAAPGCNPPGTAHAPAWQALLAAMPHAAWVVALDTRRVVAANPAAGVLLGCPCAELVGRAVEDLAASPEDLAWWEAARQGQAEPIESDAIVAAGDGRILHVRRSIGLAASAPGQAGAGHALVVMCDRGAEQRSQVEREGLLADLQATLEATADGILVTDLGGHVRAFNRRLAELFAMPLELLRQRDDVAVQAWMARGVTDTLAYAGRVQELCQAVLISATDRLELHSGQLLERVTRPLIRAGQPQGRVWSFRDLTERIVAQERAEALERHDALTGLPNRRVLTERVSAAAGAGGHEGHAFALLVIDLDRFRHINASLGHESADRVLRDVVRRIQGCLRQHDLLARVGGDQFAVLLQPADAAAAEATARRVLNVVAQPCSLDGAHFTLTCSIGMALAPSHGNGMDDLMRHAEAAMRSVKASGRAHYRLHQVRAESNHQENMRLDHAMRQALVSGRFRLHYQPQVNMASGHVVGAEALIRWRDPELGELAPARFIPVAEDSGFIVAIGDWVLGQAVRQAALWHQRGRSLPIAVNVSALQFEQANFVDRVASLLAVAGVPASLLELELTESILLHDVEEALHRLNALHRLGVRMAIDDFGTGYSSLAYLKRFPIGKLKIDRSFVLGLPGDDSDAAIVRAILQMAKALGMKVIAEGVETEAQRQFLAEAGCDEFQGFLYAAALDSLSFDRRVARSEAALPPEGKRLQLVRT